MIPASQKALPLKKKLGILLAISQQNSSTTEHRTKNPPL
jgi:hypothetical protein